MEPILNLAPHPQRDAVLAEVHARPFHPLPTPRRLVHFAFMLGGDRAAADRAALAAFCAARAVPPPPEGARHHRADLPGVSLRWEQHTEFTTYTWEFAGTAIPFSPPARTPASIMASLPQPGPLLSAADLHLIAASDAVTPERIPHLFDPASLAMSEVEGGAAISATDFHADADGFVRILVVDRGLGPAQAGAVAQRLLEIETYRTLALLGLPEAQSLGPKVKGIEDALTRIANAMTGKTGLDADHKLLDELTALAAALEAEAASSGYRFGASRAYDGIVQQRLAAIHEAGIGGWPTIAEFLARRMGPAMRTCAIMEERQQKLSEKLARAANLLRTRVDVEIERQNRDLLSAMNERTRLQLRLQQTVEGLSVAAISYYIVGLASYLFKGLKDVGLLPFDPGLATAIVVPIAVVAVALVVRRIRNHQGDGL
jgi:uncharacterized membrane-anchored protein